MEKNKNKNENNNINTKIERDTGYFVKTRTWLFTFLCMNIPIIGFIYLIYLSFSKHNMRRREFARAYLLFKIIIFLVSIIILVIAFNIIYPYAQQLLNYIDKL